MEIIKVENLSFSYPKQERKALKNINLQIKEGEFILVCGKSGCGKTTLLKQLKPQLTPVGSTSGIIKYYDKDIHDCSGVKTSSEIGYVMQDCEAQIVTDKVWHELAFGLENMGLDTATIRRRVAEMASFFGIQGWFRKNINELSGGQKQLLNLASIMVMQPKIIILDEPTSQLDPIAAKDFLSTILKINRELGTTIIITEHNLEGIFSYADKVLVMDNSEVFCFDTPINVAKFLCNTKNHIMIKALPTATKIYNSIPVGEKCPLTVREGKGWIEKYTKDKKIIIKNDGISDIKANNNCAGFNKIAIELKDVWFKYDKAEELVLRNVCLKVFKGEIYSLLGGNGVGKSTMLSIISNERKPLKGKILVQDINVKKYRNKELFKNNMAVLPQNPQSMFVLNKLKDDLIETCGDYKISKEECKKKVESVSEMLHITNVLNQHPYDLSGGEMQKAAMAKIMLREPKILLLDEPTKGLDANAKEEFGEILLKLKADGITILMVTHDVEFSAKYSDRCGLFFDGNIVSEGIPKEFFADNNFYTTAANRISRNVMNGAVTCEDVIKACAIMTEKQE